MENLTEAFQQFLTQTIAFLPKVIAALVVFVLSLVAAGTLSRSVQRALERRQYDPELTLLLKKITHWSVIVLGLMLALEQVEFDLSAFLAGLGILGFTVGFAIQDVSKNFVAGLLLLLQQPFDIGNNIEVSGFVGTVTGISMRATELRTLDGKHALIPNADVFTSPIINYSRTSRRRIQLKVGVAYESDLEEVEETAVDVIGSIEGVMSEPSPQVVFDNFGASTVDFSLYYWIDTERLGVFEGTAIGVKAIKSKFEQAGIDMPYPIQHVYYQGEKK